jgi:ABC-type transporter MlaC component
MLLIGAFLLLYSFNAYAESPIVEIKSTVDQAIQILTDPQLRGESKKQERRKRLRDAIFVRFDFQEMAQRSLGAHWQRRTPEEQTEFIRSLATCWSKPMWIRSSLTTTRNSSI